jgi:DNA-binding CsgD family transcriptional regulator
MAASAGDVVGRDEQLLAISSFLELDLELSGARALILEGEAGIGKTTLWRAGLDEARARGYRVLACGGAESETRLSFTSLRDLVADVFDDVADKLPSPQRRIIAVILLREEPTGPASAPDTVAVAFLSTLRALAARAPTLLAIDDVQWLDPASASALAFAARRLRTEQIRLLVAQRVGDRRATPLGLDRAFGDDLRRLRVDALSLGALHRILSSRLDLALTRPALQRVHHTCGGNPLFALEIGRVLRETPELRRADEPLPVPRDVAELLAQRITRLTETGREAVLAAALHNELSAAVVERAADRSGLDEATTAGVLIADRERLRFAHPLFAEATISLTPVHRRREMHRRLAALLDDQEAKAQHLALGTSEPASEVAATLDVAAEGARRRGAIASAAALAEHAARLTPADDLGEVARRTITAAVWWVDAGDMRRCRELVEPLLATLPSGTLRAQALSAKARTAADREAYRALIEEALVEAEGSPSDQVQLLFQLCHAYMHSLDFDAARDRAQLTVALAERTGDVGRNVFALSLAGRLHAGTTAFDMLRRTNELERGTPGFDAYDSAATWLGWWLLANDELDDARQLLADQGSRALDDGDEWSRTWLAWPLTELECRAGNYDAARAYAEEAGELAEQSDNLFALWLSPYCHALVAAHTGDTAAATASAEESLARTRTIHSELFSIRPRIALALLAASEERYVDVLTHLEGLSELALTGPYWVTYPFWGDLFGALVSLGRLEEAQTLLAEIDDHRHAVERPGTAPTLARCRGLVLAASGSVDEGIAWLEEALRLQEGRPAPLERARTLLALGEAQRRAKQRRVARETLQQALGIFEELGAELWTERARRELTRIGGRAPRGVELTPSELRIAGLVAEGKKNKEVAAALVVTERTVESALTQIYRKLDIRSRTELVRKLTQTD